ncbi:MAG: type II toxin-antitoxin system prevent-host-death family antitoxin [Gemmatimonadaceae bacterium]
MKTVSVSQLKARLSHYLREVRRGSEIQVLDRGVPVARLTGVDAAAEDADDRRQRLARAGVLRMGSGDLDRLLRGRPIAAGSDLSGALRADRDDRV